MSPRPFLAALALSLAGCLQEVPDNIPCDSDDTCPTDYWCNSIERCVPLSESGPPAVVFDGVRPKDGGAFGKSIEVAYGQSGSAEVQISNKGRSQAAYPDVTFEAPPCLRIESRIAGNLVGYLEPGQSYSRVISFNKPEAGCASPVTVNVKIDYDKRGTSDSFQVMLR